MDDKEYQDEINQYNEKNKYNEIKEYDEISKYNEKYQYRIAVASSDGIVVNNHFGRADKFIIYNVDINNKADYVETRNVKPICEGGTHDDNRMYETVCLFRDCKYVLVSRIGQGAAYALESVGVTPMELPGMIEESIQKLVVYEELQNLF